MTGPNRYSYSARAQSWILAALAVLAIVNLGGMALHLDVGGANRNIEALVKEPPDEISALDRQYQPLRQALREAGVHGAVGYITEGKPEDVFADIEKTRKYYLAQYALAPIVVKSNPAGLKYVIGDFALNRTAKVSGYPDLQQIFDAHNGLVLFRRRTE